MPPQGLGLQIQDHVVSLREEHPKWSESCTHASLPHVKKGNRNLSFQAISSCQRMLTVLGWVRFSFLPAWCAPPFMKMGPPGTPLVDLGCEEAGPHSGSVQVCV